VVGGLVRGVFRRLDHLLPDRVLFGVVLPPGHPQQPELQQVGARARHTHGSDTPPPSYDQFAPPSYESICLGRHERGEEKSKYDIYVVPVHALGHMMETRDDAPPSYFSASGRDFVPAVATVENNRSRVT
jgi:hypothetical protein